MMVWALLLIVSIVVPTLFVFIIIRLVKGGPVELSKGTDAFNNVAVKVETLVGLGRLDERIGQDILESVINSLDVLGWDTQDEAMREFQSTPFVIQAFENCGHKLLEV